MGLDPSRLFKIILAAFSLFLYSDYAFSGEENATVYTEAQVDAYLKQVASLNHGIGLDGGGSLGNEGTRFGIGIRRVIADEVSTDLTNANLYTNQKAGSTIDAPFVMLSKGLFDKFNFGMNLGTYNQHKVTLWQMHLQYTLFEDFRMPAVAWRVQRMQTFGLQSTSYQGYQTGPVVTYAPLSFLTFNLRGGWTYNQAKADSDFGRQKIVYLANTETDRSFSKTWMSTYVSVGAMVFVMPPFGHVGVEWIKMQDTADSYLGTLSLNI